jgi:hypothetical protein
MEEWVASAAIRPGMLIEQHSSTQVRPHATQDGNAVPMFAIEDALQGKQINDNYASADQVQCWCPRRGDWVYALLADGQNAAIGSFLTSNGDGYLRVYTGGSAATEDLPLEIVAQAMEAVDRSSSSGGDTNVTGRIKVRIV